MPDTHPFLLPAVAAQDALHQAKSGAVLVDLRPAKKVAADGRRVAGALTRNAFDFGHDDPLTRDPRRLIVFCQRGEEVGQYGCAMLLMHGRDVAYVTGGIEALAAAGAATNPAE